LTKENAYPNFTNSRKSLGQNNFLKARHVRKNGRKLIFIHQMDWQKDFNQENYDWNFRGAYSGCCINKGWKLSLDTIPTQKRNPTISFHPDQIKFLLYPNPFNNNISIDSESEGFAFVYDQNGKIISSFKISKGLHTINLEHLSPGIYTLSLQSDKGTIHRKIIK